MLRLRVKELAQQQGLGQGKLARKADVDIKTLARIYKNPYVEVSSVTLEKLARALSVSIADLIEEIDDDGKNEEPSKETNE
jgi:transcriptional regulator with XRE-family HTH domain